MLEEKEMSQFKPMLAGKVDLEKLRYPVYVSPKYDGIRAIVINGVVYSRNLKQIPNKHVQKLFGKKLYSGFDGELIVGHPTDKDCFNKTSSGVMSVEGEPDVKFYVFDKVGSDQWVKRFWTHCQVVEKYGVYVVLHELVRSEKELLEFEKVVISLGYEGVMIRSPGGLYKYGRSTTKEGYLLKLKQFEDSEAEIIDFKELEINLNEATVNELGNKTRSTKKAGMSLAGMLGSFVVRDIKTKVEFDIGTGFTDMQRTEFWTMKKHYLGKVAKYKFQPAGTMEKPRFPVFLGFRSEIDM